MSDSRLKSVAESCLGLIVIAALIALPLVIAHGMVWVSERAWPWLDNASYFTFFFDIIVLLPLSFFRRTRHWAGNGFFISSYLFGTLLVAFSCIVAFQVWGYVGLVFGILFAGIGVVPVAYVAAITHGMWSVLGDLVYATVLTFGMRALAFYLLAKAGSDGEPGHNAALGSGQVIDLKSSE